MTKEEIQILLGDFRNLGLTLAALLQEPETQEACLSRVAYACGRPLREYLLNTDPEDDPMLWAQAAQALEALREDQIWIQRLMAGQGTPFHTRWQ